MTINVATIVVLICSFGCLLVTGASLSSNSLSPKKEGSLESVLESAPQPKQKLHPDQKVVFYPSQHGSFCSTCVSNENWNFGKPGSAKWCECCKNCGTDDTTRMCKKEGFPSRCEAKFEKIAAKQRINAKPTPAPTASPTPIPTADPRLVNVVQFAASSCRRACRVCESYKKDAEDALLETKSQSGWWKKKKKKKNKKKKTPAPTPAPTQAPTPAPTPQPTPAPVQPVSTPAPPQPQPQTQAPKPQPQTQAPQPQPQPQPQNVAAKVTITPQPTPAPVTIAPSPNPTPASTKQVTAQPSPAPTVPPTKAPAPKYDADLEMRRMMMKAAAVHRAEKTEACNTCGRCSSVFVKN